MRHLTLLFSFQIALACAPPEPPTGSATPATGPSLGKADAADQADHTCQIVLRGVHRQAGSAGHMTRCSASGCNWVWVGSVEVAEAVQGATVHILYRLAGQPSWWQVDATPASWSQPGFARYDFEIHEHLIGPSATEAELAAASVELMPFLALPDGTRLFDHNRRPGAFENYVLEQAGGFMLDDGGACAAVFGRISFTGLFDEYLTGALRQDGYLVIDYDLERLPKCRGTGWDTVAQLSFSPGGQLVSGSVQANELSIKIPSDAAAVQIWFRNADADGCESWDSSYGANYLYEIWPSISDPRCKEIDKWSEVNSDMPYRADPYCLSYTVDQHTDADLCEHHLSGIGDGYVGHYGIPNHWLEAYLTVGTQQGTLLGAGMWTLYRDADTGLYGQRVTIGRQVAPDTWQTGFIYHKTGMMGAKGVHRDVEEMAFFIDVKRPTGQVVRLWQSRHGQNYAWDDAFAQPTTTKYIAYGNIRYAGPTAEILDGKRACAP